VGALGTLIYLLRHGEIEDAERRRFVGHVDVALSPRGVRQAAAQAHRLRESGLTAIFTSDLARARHTGEIIGAPHGLRPTIVPALREMNMGRWDGLTAVEITERDPAGFAAWTARIAEVPFPDGESASDLLARAWPAFSGLLHRRVVGPIAVVGHGPGPAPGSLAQLQSGLRRPDRSRARRRPVATAPAQRATAGPLSQLVRRAQSPRSARARWARYAAKTRSFIS
jgi:broad specificity phosphatase PhoE